MAEILNQGWIQGLLLVIIFVSVTAVAFELARGFEQRLSVRNRLAEDTSAPAVRPTAGTSLRAVRTRSAWSDIVSLVEKRGLSLEDTKGHLLRKRLIAAGFDSPDAPKIYTLVRLLLTLLLPGLLVAYILLAKIEISLFVLYWIGAVLAIVGLYVPSVIVDARAARKRDDLIHGFPNALDLMLVCVESGLGLEAAFDRVGQELSLTHPRIAELIGSVVLELRAGRVREEALRTMADKSEVDEIRSFATLLIQSDKLGSSIGQTLRVYASEMREKRRLRAEEKAHRLPVLLSIPLVTCMLPVMIGVLMLPAVIRIARDLLPLLSR